jgi:hypothetical protein
MKNKIKNPLVIAYLEGAEDVLNEIEGGATAEHIRRVLEVTIKSYLMYVDKRGNDDEQNDVETEEDIDIRKEVRGFEK